MVLIDNFNYDGADGQGGVRAGLPQRGVDLAAELRTGGHSANFRTDRRRRGI
jgi:hypothetical protein